MPEGHILIHNVIQTHSAFRKSTNMYLIYLLRWGGSSTVVSGGSCKVINSSTTISDKLLWDKLSIC